MPFGSFKVNKRGWQDISTGEWFSHLAFNFIVLVCMGLLHFTRRYPKPKQRRLITKKCTRIDKEKKSDDYKLELERKWRGRSESWHLQKAMSALFLTKLVSAQIFEK